MRQPLLRARACTSSCLDQCSTGVTILVEPDHFFYGRVTEADVPKIVAAIAQGGRVERLVMTATDLALGFPRIKAIRRDKGLDAIDTLAYAHTLARQHDSDPRL